MKLRKKKAIMLAEEAFADKLWYNRHQIVKQMKENGDREVDEKGWEAALKAEAMLEEKYGKDNLGPYDDFEWGMINGKLSALRWILGDDWDQLDS